MQTVEQFKAAVTVTRGQESVDGASILDLLMLAAGPGVTITITCERTESRRRGGGAVRVWVNNRFGEEERPHA